MEWKVNVLMSPLEIPCHFSIISEQRRPIVKWYYAAFALLRRESDSPWVHKISIQLSGKEPYEYLVELADVLIGSNNEFRIARNHGREPFSFRLPVKT